jgi:membrane fusion protein (multidrug efflux system)
MSKKILKITLLLSGSFLFGCTSDQHTDNSPETNKVLPVTTIISRDTVMHREYISEIQAVQNVEIRVRVTGFLEKIFVDEGQDVKKGQALFQINNEEYQAELAKASANMKSAIAEAKATELEVDRVKMLVDKKVVTKTELELAKAKHEAAKARIEEARSAQSNARIKLSYTYIRAPFNGIVDRIPLKVGSLVKEGTLLTTVSDNRAVYAYFNVSENEYLHYVKSLSENPQSNSDVVELTLADGSTFPHTGKIETMEGDFERVTGSIAFRARFPNPDKLLKHGASGRIRLTNKVADALMIPQKAVFEIQDKNYVFIVDTNNTVTMKSFVPKSRISHFYIVESGLAPGDKVIYEGLQDLREGMQITPQFITMDSLITMAPQATETLID